MRVNILSTDLYLSPANQNSTGRYFSRSSSFEHDKECRHSMLALSLSEVPRFCLKNGVVELTRFGQLRPFLFVFCRLFYCQYVDFGHVYPPYHCPFFLKHKIRFQSTSKFLWRIAAFPTYRIRSLILSTNQSVCQAISQSVGVYPTKHMPNKQSSCFLVCLLQCYAHVGLFRTCFLPACNGSPEMT